MLAWTLKKSPVPYSISPGRSRTLHILGCFNQFQTLLGVGLSWDRLASHTEWEFAHFQWYFWVLFNRVQRRVLRRRVEAECLRLPFLCIPTNCHRSNHILPEAPEETDPRAKPCSDSPPLAVLVVLENTKGSFASLSSIFFSSLFFISFCFLYVSDETKSRLWKQKGHSPHRATLTETPGSPFALLSKVLSAFLCCFFTQRKDFFTILSPFLSNPGVRGWAGPEVPFALSWWNDSPTVAAENLRMNGEPADEEGGLIWLWSILSVISISVTEWSFRHTLCELFPKSVKSTLPWGTFLVSKSPEVHSIPSIFSYISNRIIANAIIIN